MSRSVVLLALAAATVVLVCDERAVTQAGAATPLPVRLSHRISWVPIRSSGHPRWTS